MPIEDNRNAYHTITYQTDLDLRIESNGLIDTWRITPAFSFQPEIPVDPKKPHSINKDQVEDPIIKTSLMIAERNQR